MMFEKRELREEVARGWRRPHNEELHNLHSSTNIIRMSWVGHVASLGEMYTKF